ncbi:MAG: hypothetical protein EKK31_10785 [Hyphomicrobiales bacterium]|nr:MAG: hypothetical protein EKK31_10785 [Hyphomicrobiales bacterium]
MPAKKFRQVYGHANSAAAPGGSQWAAEHDHGSADEDTDEQPVVVLFHDFSFKTPEELLAGLTRPATASGNGGMARALEPGRIKHCKIAVHLRECRIDDLPDRSKRISHRTRASRATYENSEPGCSSNPRINKSPIHPGSVNHAPNNYASASSTAF